MANLKPINEEFSNSSYNNDSRLSQPSSGVRQIRNIETKQRYDPDKRRGGVADRTASSWGESMQASRTADTKTNQKRQAEGVRSVATSEYQNANAAATRSSSPTRAARKKGWGKKKLSKSVTGKLLGRSVTLSIWSWGFFIWLFFQLPIAILSIIFMALTEAVYQFSLSLEPTAEGNFIVEGIKAGAKIILNTLVDAVNHFMDLALGFDLNTLHPANVFMLTHTLVMLVGWGMLLAISIIYTMTSQKAFSGNGAGGKNTLFILAFVGYAIPILNLLPLFFFWTLLVLKNPK